jgi:hypothetical protein
VSERFNGVLSSDSDVLNEKLELNAKMGLVIANRGISSINEVWLQKNVFPVYVMPTPEE